MLPWAWHILPPWSLKPGKHRHWNDPLVLTQVCMQGPKDWEHSSISTEQGNIHSRGLAKQSVAWKLFTHIMSVEITEYFSSLCQNGREKIQNKLKKNPTHLPWHLAPFEESFIPVGHEHKAPQGWSVQVWLQPPFFIAHLLPEIGGWG